MTTFLAALVALFLLASALSLASALQAHRRRRQAAREAAGSRGRAIIAELPTGPDLTLFSEDPARFYYGERAIDKGAVRAVRVLINGSPIAAYVSRRFPGADAAPPTSFDDRPDGIARDRWDVAIETVEETVIVECGAIRERVSQELARRIYDAVKSDLENRDKGN